MRTSLIFALLVCTASMAAEKPLVVHEWGTFTSVQDPTGRAIGWINSNDEPLPEFVHRIGSNLIINDSLTQLLSKGVVRGLPDVTMRLETPVIYFHPADDAPTTVSVRATFHGGLLSEFYPIASSRTTIAGKPTTQPAAKIDGSTVGSLDWRDISLGGSPKLPVTDSHVWLSPRLAKSAAVTVGKESEQYIFYRGIGHLDAPIRVTRAHDNISIRDQRSDALRGSPLKLGAVWLAEFNADGACAFQPILNPIVDPRSCSGIAFHAAVFAANDFSSDNVAKLRDSMHSALMSEGLFDDEATAMLETWKLSYFKSVGQRLFFIVPRDWTDAVLPLEISKPCELTRVMVGRIELVTPQQLQNVKELATQKPPQQRAGELYQSLGRFADALIADYRRSPAAIADAVK